MRPAPILPSLAVALCLASLPALAQQPGWIDPPAKPPAAEPTEGRSMPGEPSRSAEQARPPGAAPKAKPLTADETGMAAAPSAPTRREAGGGAAPAMRNPAAEGKAEAPRIDPTRVGRAAPEESARKLVADYLATVSGDGMAETTPRFYGDWVRFHDRLLSRQALVAEKRRFVRRWPERRYVAEGAPRVMCSDASRTCIVRTLVRFEAASTARGSRSRGLAELTLTITLGEGRPVIVSETSRVVRRGLASGAGERFIPAG